MSHPQLSVVIASCVGPPFIVRCLESLDRHRRALPVEFIVADRAGGRVAELIERQFPWVKLIRSPGGRSVPDLRRDAIARAEADHVAIIEEHCVASERWIETILEAIKQPAAAIGGPVHDDGYDRLMDWAVYFTEYNSYMPPVERGPTFNICGANCVYQRDLLNQHLPHCGSGYWEADLNARLLAAGERFLMEPEMVIRHTGPFKFCYYLRQRFLFSRAFAGIRRQHKSRAYRIAYLLAAPLLVPLLFVRTARRVLGRRQYAARFIRVCPLLAPITLTYVFGEWVGYLMGPGDSLSKIE
jgi:hypothetical protein